MEDHEDTSRLSRSTIKQLYDEDQTLNRIYIYLFQKEQFHKLSPGSCFNHNFLSFFGKKRRLSKL